MDREELKKIIDSPDQYEDIKDDSVFDMVKVFYSKRMRSVAILVWAWAVIFSGGSILCVIRFFAVADTRAQIMYAALFICFFHGIGLMKIFAWSMVQRHGIKREIKRLELRIAELSERNC
jgi:hypothetical protein